MTTYSSTSLIEARHDAAPVPLAALVISTILSMVTVCILAVFLAHRLKATRNWRSLPVTNWFVFAIYIDSILFVLFSAVLYHGWGLNSSPGACEAAIVLCLVFYLTVKLLIYFFLVEKVFVIRSVAKGRWKSKLWLFNCFGVLIPFIGVIVLNFVYRIHRFRDGTCIIGMEKQVILPLILYDLAINVWLTSLFIVPLRQLYTFKNNPKSKLRTVVIRAFVGSCVALLSSIVNLSILNALKGEPAWVCLMCCNSDILVNTVVVHWVTSRDAQSAIITTGTQELSTNTASNLRSRNMQSPLHNNTSRSLVANRESSQVPDEEGSITDVDGSRDPKEISPISLALVESESDLVREVVSEGKDPNTSPKGEIWKPLSPMTAVDNSKDVVTEGSPR